MSTTILTVETQIFPVNTTVPVEISVVGGPPGPGANRYVHNQSSPSDEWIINHNLGVIPAGITIYSPGGVEVEAQIVHMTINQLRVYFGSPATGKVSII